MSETLEIPKWVEEIMGLWEKHHRRTLPRDVREVWREAHRKKAEELKRIERDKLVGWRRAWVEYLTESNEVAAKTGINLRIGDSDLVPRWYKNLEEEVMGAYMPTVNFKSVLQQRPSQTIGITCGEFVGHEYMIWAGNQVLIERLKRAPNEGGKPFLRLVEYLRPRRLRMIDKALAIANRQPYRDCRQFFRGYYLALDRGTFNASGEPSGSTYATPIYLWMYAFADFLPLLKNNRELLEWLKAVLGNTQSWSDKSYKRIEKLTQRIDLHLEKLHKRSDG